jgi:hypothetical protein
MRRAPLVSPLTTTHPRQAKIGPATHGQDKSTVRTTPPGGWGLMRCMYLIPLGRGFRGGVHVFDSLIGCGYPLWFLMAAMRLTGGYIFVFENKMELVNE